MHSAASHEAIKSWMMDVPDEAIQRLTIWQKKHCLVALGAADPRRGWGMQGFIKGALGPEHFSTPGPPTPIHIQRGGSSTLMSGAG